jgi:Flp pilus assembly protein TadG
MRRILQRLRHCTKGMAATEFALVLPILVLVYCGVVEFTALILVQRKVIAAAQSTADLITQESTVTSTDINDIVTAARLIFDPYPTATLSMTFASMRFDATTGQPAVEWQELSGGGVGGNELVPLAVGLGLPGEGVVITVITYAYTPIFADLITGTVTLTERAFARPRRSKIVTRS